MRRDVTVSPVGCGNRYGVRYTTKPVMALPRQIWPRLVWLNTITAPLSRPKNNNFSCKINEKSSIPGPVRASQRAAVLSVLSVHDCVEITPLRASDGA